MAQSGSSLDALPKGTLTKLGVITESTDGKFVNRMAIVDNGEDAPLEGLCWKPAEKRKDLEALDDHVGKEVRYDYTAGTAKKQAKLNIYTINEPKSGSGSSGSSGGGKSSGGGWKGGSGKGEGSDAYWASKTAEDFRMNDWRVAREAANDAKIEWQAYANIIQPLVTEGLRAGRFDGSPGKALEWLIKAADGLYKQRNPNGPLVPPARPVAPPPPPPAAPEAKEEKPAASAPKAAAPASEDDDLPF